MFPLKLGTRTRMSTVTISILPSTGSPSHRTQIRKRNWKRIQIGREEIKLFADDTRYVYVLSHFSHVQLFSILWTVACQAPLSMGILQARIQEQVAISSPRGSSQALNTCLLCLLHWQVGYLSRMPPGKPNWIENLKISIKNLLELMYEFSKATGY